METPFVLRLVRNIAEFYTEIFRFSHTVTLKLKKSTKTLSYRALFPVFECINIRGLTSILRSRYRRVINEPYVIAEGAVSRRWLFQVTAENTKVLTTACHLQRQP